MRIGFLNLARRITDLFLLISQGALLCMMLVIVADVIMRTAMGAPIRGTYDIVGILLCISALFAVGHVILSNQAVVIDLIDMVVPARGARGLARIWSLVGVVALAGIVAAMLGPLTEARLYGDRSLELGLPLWIVWVIAVIGMTGAVLAALAAIFAPLPGHAALEESGE
ncbi:TRAP transporter small permease [Thioclava sp. SK-1]|uniref:TRAP transporter small permease n=1 Tax=Thioclava sp. SK-1 TaxID=1889770 RepID=UPI000A9EE9BA|nr:TRAP transporter small permease [Thioclava sp. SK-1]